MRVEGADLEEVAPDVAFEVFGMTTKNWDGMEVDPAGNDDMVARMGQLEWYYHQSQLLVLSVVLLW